MGFFDDRAALDTAKAGAEARLDRASRRLAESWPFRTIGPCSTVAFRPMHSSTGSEHSSRSSEAKLFGIEFSYLHVSKQDSVKAGCDQLDSQLFEAEYLADEYSVLVPANVAAIVDSSQQETLRVCSVTEVLSTLT